MSHRFPLQAPRWLLPAWLGTLFCYGLVSLSAAADQVFFLPALLAHLSQVILFGLLLGGFCLALWLHVTRIRQVWLSRLLFFVQVCLALGIIAILPGANIVFAILAVILALQVMARLKQPHLLVTVCVCAAILGLFLLGLFIQVFQHSQAQQEQQTITSAPVGRLIAPTASPFPTLDLLSVPLLLLAVVSFLMLYVHLARAHAQLATTHLVLQASTERIETLTRVTERQRLARELHDTLSQGLAGVTMQLQATQVHLAEQHYPQAEAMVASIRETVRALLTTSRSTITELRATSLGPEQVQKAVQEEIDRFERATGIACHTDLVPLAALPATCGEAVVRALGEGLTNIARHAQAHQVWIRLDSSADAFTLEVKDDGIGFDPGQRHQQSGHYGLIGLRERARVLGGECTVASVPGQGTTLCFSFPTERSEHVYV